MEKKCKNCECWESKNDGTGEGLCLAHAPKSILMIATNKEISIIRPTTKPDERCVHDFVEAKIV